MSLRRTSKDLKFFLLPSLIEWDKITPKSWQKHQFFVNFYQVILPKEFLPKSFSQKTPPKKIRPHKKFLSKNSSKNFSKNISKKIPQKIQKMLKQFLKKLSRFWKYPIPYIALGGRKPFRACCFRTFSSPSFLLRFVFISVYYHNFTCNLGLWINPF